jgi:beta-N-acetylhexosaminidase
MPLRELRRHIGRLAVVGFSGESVPGDLRRLAAAFDLAGVVYFARNVVEPRQVAELSREVADLSQDWPLWISVDQEGGRVARLRRPFTEWPPMLTLGRSRDDRLAERFARSLAAELRAVGINLDYAPVLDVRTNSKNQVIGDRAIADSAEEVARLGRIIVRTLQAEGIAACGKHFPGHGDTTGDSHEELPLVEHGPDRLAAVEWLPFRAAIAESVATMMVAHVLVPALDEDRPASLSSHIVTDLLKHDLGFSGVVVSDDLGMKAITTSRSLATATVDAIAAGCDVVLLCNSTVDEQVQCLETAIRAAESGVLSERRLDDAFARQRRVKERFLPRKSSTAALDVVGCAEHQAVAEEMAGWR